MRVASLLPLLLAPHVPQRLASDALRLQLIIPGQGGGDEPKPGLIIDDGASSQRATSGGLLLGGNGGGSAAPPFEAAGSGGILLGDGSAAAEPVDPMQAQRPRYDLAAASGRPDERVFGAASPRTADELGEWGEFLRAQGISHVLSLHSDAEAAALSPDGTADGYDAVLAEIFKQSSRLDLSAAGASSGAHAACEAAVAARSGIAITCAGGGGSTASTLVLAQWLLKDYIGGDNCLEACDLLAARHRKSGVQWHADEAELAALLEHG